MSILIVSNNDLLQTGVARLLDKTGNIIIQKIIPDDEQEITRQIQQMGIEVVIVDASIVIPGSAQVTWLLNATRNLRILLLNIHSNEVHIYDKREVQLELAEDLLTLI